MKHNFKIFLIITAVNVLANGIVEPFETEDNSKPAQIDSLIKSVLNKNNITAANLCSDEVFIRRVYIDVIGKLPSSGKTASFLKDQRAEKRALLIDELLASEDFADYWSLKWCDILRVKAEFPINLWPNAVQAYHHWIRDSIKSNMPYDKFAYELLTSSGSNFRVPQVNFYRAVQHKQPSSIASGFTG
ncbi:MAG: hypothetical protein BWY69_00857 [Planctomycetes bacterium ADurb.Bin401]|nr:MAG: hypothetical protein BWY69_00857 [Planctomycetes bacterium ADurb.Bin401]